jgi:hypothetical protein
LTTGSLDDLPFDNRIIRRVAVRQLAALVKFIDLPFDDLLFDDLPFDEFTWYHFAILLG